MPEGDTVLRTGRELDAALSGHRLAGSDFRVPRLATVDLTGRLVLSTLARGKHLLTRIEGDPALTLHTHLGMEGAWHVAGPGQRPRRPTHRTRVVLTTATHQALGSGLARVDLLRTTEEHRIVGTLGPDLLADDWDPELAEHNLAAQPGRTIGEALLDQRSLAGIGNIYRSEACFLAGIHPGTPTGAVHDLGRLVDLARRLMLANTERTARVTTGDLRRGRRLWVYGRGGLPCRRCGTSIRTARIGDSGSERAAYWCPACQPGP